ncbi:cytochrome P450 [Patellaria atrata CBS 101060]|uniref:Cytochrome P450 n=1 Tax=Patellaria atrata CBS 101060 TaxID=1346257 RepID=A0A9P4SAB2_9PEZI|nr:cytochrome P450 [Patellaria atrata CBS 101060]
MHSHISVAIYERFPVIIIVLSTIAAFIFIPHILIQDPISQLPIIGIEHGNTEKRRQAFIATKLPDDILSFDEPVGESLSAKYTKLIFKNPIFPHTVKQNLTPALVRLNPRISQEVEEAITREIPPCKDWTKVNVNQKLLRIVAMVSGCVFIGPEISRSEAYIDAAINYTIELVVATNAVKKVRPILRSFPTWRLAEIKSLDRWVEEAYAFLNQWLRQGEMQRKGRWLMGNAKDFEVDTDEDMARIQLGISFASIHTTTLTATNALYSFAAWPEYIEPVRDEIRTVLAQHDGIFTTRAIQDMKKLDSFIKESARQFPASLDAYRYLCGATARNQFISVTQNVMTFGYGRHACPGRFFAANEIKMIVAKMLLRWDMKNIGEEGRCDSIYFGGQSFPDPTKELLLKKVQD